MILLIDLASFSSSRTTGWNSYYGHYDNNNINKKLELRPRRDKERIDGHPVGVVVRVAFLSIVLADKLSNDLRIGYGYTSLVNLSVSLSLRSCTNHSDRQLVRTLTLELFTP